MRLVRSSEEIIPVGWWGGLVGGNPGGSLTSCYATGLVSGEGAVAVGGLVGGNGGSLTSCYATGSVSEGSIVGGLVGSNDGMLTSCYATGSVTGNTSVGGLVGGNEGEDMLTSCYATGSVCGEGAVGWLVGNNGFCSLTSCYATGLVCGEGAVGGLVGGNPGGPLTSCFWDTQTSGKTVGVGDGASTGVTGKTTAEMKTLSTFTGAGWDFVSIWSICEGTNYPRLRWQIPVADWVCPDGVNMEDLSYFVQRWLESDCAPSNNYCGGVDMNGSGAVDLADFAILASHWLEGL